MTGILYVWNRDANIEERSRETAAEEDEEEDRSSLQRYEFVEGTTIAKGVTTVALFHDDSSKEEEMQENDRIAIEEQGRRASERESEENQIVAVFKYKKSFPYDGGTLSDALERVKRIIIDEESTIFAEHVLHAYLLKKQRKYIAQLVFPSQNAFAFLVSKRTVTPVKVTRYYAHERASRDALRIAEMRRRIAESRIDNALKQFYPAKDARATDTDWKHPRNRFFVKNRFVYHDFDNSI